jgi:hypothetical protein
MGKTCVKEIFSEIHLTCIYRSIISVLTESKGGKYERTEKRSEIPAEESQCPF